MKRLIKKCELGNILETPIEMVDYSLPPTNNVTTNSENLFTNSYIVNGLLKSRPLNWNTFDAIYNKGKSSKIPYNTLMGIMASIAFDGIPTNGVKIHEFTHASHPTLLEQYIMNVIYKDRKVPNVVSGKHSHVEDIDNAKEIYGALLQYRYEHNLKPTLKIDLKYINSHRDSFKDTYLDKVSDTDKIRLFNEVAQNDTPTNILLDSSTEVLYGANGGHLFSTGGDKDDIGYWSIPLQNTYSNTLNPYGVVPVSLDAAQGISKASELEDDHIYLNPAKHWVLATDNKGNPIPGEWYESNMNEEPLVTPWYVGWNGKIDSSELMKPLADKTPLQLHDMVRAVSNRNGIGRQLALFAPGIFNPIGLAAGLLGGEAVNEGSAAFYNYLHPDASKVNDFGQAVVRSITGNDDHPYLEAGVNFLNPGYWVGGLGAKTLGSVDNSMKIFHKNLTNAEKALAIAEEVALRLPQEQKIGFLESMVNKAKSAITGNKTEAEAPKRLTVDKEYFHSPNKWYRVTETPEVYGIEEAGKNVTTKDMANIETIVDENGNITGYQYTDGEVVPSYLYLQSASDFIPVIDDSEAFWKVRPRKKFMLSKTGAAHGNTSQAAKGQIWDGTFAYSNKFPRIVLEGEAPLEIFSTNSITDPGGLINRTNFTKLNWENLPMGSRVGFHTGEMPIENTSWFKLLPDGTFEYEGPIVPEKRINLTGLEDATSTELPNTITLELALNAAEDAYKVTNPTEIDLIIADKVANTGLVKPEYVLPTTTGWLEVTTTEPFALSDNGIFNNDESGIWKSIKDFFTPKSRLIERQLLEEKNIKKLKVLDLLDKKGFKNYGNGIVFRAPNDPEVVYSTKLNIEDLANMSEDNLNNVLSKTALSIIDSVQRYKESKKLETWWRNLSDKDRIKEVFLKLTDPNYGMEYYIVNPKYKVSKNEYLITIQSPYSNRASYLGNHELDLPFITDTKELPKLFGEERRIPTDKIVSAEKTNWTGWEDYRDAIKEKLWDDWNNNGPLRLHLRRSGINNPEILLDYFLTPELAWKENLKSPGIDFNQHMFNAKLYEDFIASNKDYGKQYLQYIEDELKQISPKFNLGKNNFVDIAYGENPDILKFKAAAKSEIEDAIESIYNNYAYNNDLEPLNWSLYNDIKKKAIEKLLEDKNIEHDFYLMLDKKYENGFASNTHGKIYISPYGKYADKFGDTVSHELGHLEDLDELIDHKPAGKALMESVQNTLFPKGDTPLFKAAFDLSKLKDPIKTYFLHTFNNNVTEMAARGSLIKDYIMMKFNKKVGEPITAKELQYARDHYIEDTRMNNNMDEFFSTIKNMKLAAKWISIHSKSLATPIIIGGAATTYEATNNLKDNCKILQK